MKIWPILLTSDREGFPEMNAKSVEQMAITHYLGCLSNPQVMLVVSPNKLEEALHSILK